MNKKILVVDDSLTIQKVVAITLAAENYNLTAAHDEEELFSALDNQSFDLILLDFSLSEELSGYDLAKKIKEKTPNSSILAMVGTFDSIDDHSLESAGVNDSIVKPFESSKFIDKCRSLLSDDGQHSSEASEEATTSEESEDDTWEINTATEINAEIPLDEFTKTGEDITKTAVASSSSTNSLREEIEGWGISMPDVIEAAEIAEEMPKVSLMPPMIEEPSSEPDAEIHISTKEKDESLVDTNDEMEDENGEGLSPSQDDLLFPESNSEEEIGEGLNSRLVSLDELKIDVDEDDEDEEDTTADIAGEETVVREFSQDEEDEDDFWAVDEEIVEESTERELEGTPAEDDEKDEDLDHEAIEFSSTNIEIGPKIEQLADDDSGVEDIVGQIKDQLKPLIEEIIEDKIKEMSQEIVERIAWEAIPDLAENLIRKEVKELSQKIQDKHSLN